MKKTVEGDDEHLDSLDKTLEQRQTFRMLSKAESPTVANGHPENDAQLQLYTYNLDLI